MKVSTLNKLVLKIMDLEFTDARVLPKIPESGACPHCNFQHEFETSGYLYGGIQETVKLVTKPWKTVPNLIEHLWFSTVPTTSKRIKTFRLECPKCNNYFYACPHCSKCTPITGNVLDEVCTLISCNHCNRSLAYTIIM